MGDLPRGTVTFVFTDIEGSTRLFRELGDGYRDLLAQHHVIMREAIARHRGVEVQTEGDAFFMAFGSATDAVAACLEAQHAMASHPWPEGFSIRVRIGMHTGEATPVDGDYVALAVHEAARVAAAGHGGQTLLSAATAGLVPHPPDGASLRDLGEHRLKDLEGPIRLFQLEHAALGSVFPPLRTLDMPTDNLPARLTSFVGRAIELAEVERLVREDRLVTLTGAGGSGKTRLAIEAAECLVEEFEHGVWLVELGASAGDGALMNAIALALDVRATTGISPTEAVLEFLRRRHLLLVIDNCEHLLDQCADVVDEVLRVAPKVHILTTSRESLGVDGERSWRVPSLSGDKDGDAVHLFVERASRARSGLAVTDDDAATIVHLCHRLDGLPLAIELAAAKCSVMSVSEIAARIDDRFRLLTGGARRELGRQQTLRATVDWSYDLLDAAEQTLLQRLSVFSGGCTLAAAETVGRTDGIDALDVVELLARLVDKSLVVVDDGPNTRYRLLETVRDYATDKLVGNGDVDEARNAHLRWAAKLAADARVGLHSSDDLRWLQVVDDEIDNVRTALEWAGQADVSTALHLGADMLLYWWVRGLFAEGRGFLEDALSTANDDPVAQVRAHAAASFLSYCMIDLEAHKAHASTAMAIDESLGRPDQLGFDAAWAAIDLAEIIRTADPERCRSLLQDALDRAVTTSQPLAESRAEQALGHLTMGLGDAEAAHAHLNRALVLSRELGHAAQNRCLSSLARWYMTANDLDAALATYREALRVAVTAGDRIGIKAGSLHLMMLAAGVGDHERVVEHAEQMLLYLDFASPTERAELLNAAAWYAAIGGSLTLGQAWVQDALAELDDVRIPNLVRRSVIHTQGEIMRLQGDVDGAEAVLTTCLDAEGDTVTRAALASLGRVSLARGDLRQAAEHLAAQARDLDSSGDATDPEEVAHLIVASASMRVAEGRHADAAQLLGCAGQILPLERRAPMYRVEHEAVSAACEGALGMSEFERHLATGEKLLPHDTVMSIAKWCTA